MQTPTQVQHTSGSGSSASAVPTALGASPTAGNLLFVWVGAKANTTFTAPDGTWTAGVLLAATGRSGQAFWKISSGSEGTTPTFGIGTSAGWAIFVEEWNKVDSGSVLAENSQTTASSTTHQSPTLSPASGDVAIAFHGYVSATVGDWISAIIAGTNGGASTEQGDLTMGSGSASLYTSPITSTTGTYWGVGTSNGTGTGGAEMAIFAGAPDAIPVSGMFECFQFAGSGAFYGY